MVAIVKLIALLPFVVTVLGMPMVSNSGKIEASKAFYVLV